MDSYSARRGPEGSESAAKRRRLDPAAGGQAVLGLLGPGVLRLCCLQFFKDMGAYSGVDCTTPFKGQKCWRCECLVKLCDAVSAALSYRLAEVQELAACQYLCAEAAAEFAAAYIKYVKEVEAYIWNFEGLL